MCSCAKPATEALSAEEWIACTRRAHGACRRLPRVAVTAGCWLHDAPRAYATSHQPWVHLPDMGLLQVDVEGRLRRLSSYNNYGDELTNGENGNTVVEQLVAALKPHDSDLQQRVATFAQDGLVPVYVGRVDTASGATSVGLEFVPKGSTLARCENNVRAAAAPRVPLPCFPLATAPPCIL